MILTCPSCGTQYVVKDGAIPPGGRQVRCASCKHSWHQDPETAEGTTEESEAAPQPIAEPPAEPEPFAEDEQETLAEAALIEPRSGPEIEERAYEQSAIEGEDKQPLRSPAQGHSAAEGATYAGMPMGMEPREQGAPEEDW